MALTLRSDSFGDGDYLGADHVLSEDFGFGCAGGNVSPALAWSGAERHEELRRDVLRPRRANRQRLLALGRRQHPAGGHERARGRRER
jgi:hypothetical protein